MNWGERVFLAYQMKVLKHFPDKLFQMTIAEIADLLVPIESKSDRQRTPSISPARRFFPTKLFRFCDLARQAKFCKARFSQSLSA